MTVHNILPVRLLWRNAAIDTAKSRGWSYPCPKGQLDERHDAEGIVELA